MRVLDVATLAQWVEAAPVNDSAQVGPDVVIDTRKGEEKVFQKIRNVMDGLIRSMGKKGSRIRTSK